MKNLVADNEKYERIFIQNSNMILKYSVIDKDTWELFIKKDLSFVNAPCNVENLENKSSELFEYRSIIYLPFLKNYETLYSEKYTKNLDTENILKLFKKNLLLLKKLHDEEIYHSDIFSKNIMINKKLDIQFIDFDSAVIDNAVSTENVYFEDNIPIEEIKKNSAIDDKIDLLNLYLKYLLNGNFKSGRYLRVDVSKLGLSSNITRELESYSSYNSYPKDYYYFNDLVEDLLKSGYESPKILERKNN